MGIFSRRRDETAAQLHALAERVTSAETALTEARTSLVQSRASVAFRDAGITGGGESSELMVLSQAYEQVPWISAPIDAIADHITAGGWELAPATKGASEVEKTRIENLFLFVNDDEDLNELINRTVKSMLIFGRAFWEIDGGTGTGDPLALYYVDPVTMSAVYDQQGTITGYIQRMEDGEKIEFKPEQILMFRESGPRGETMSPIRKLLTSATVYNYMMRWGQKFFEHGAKPPFALKLSEDTDDADGDRQLDWYSEQYSGAENAHKIWVLWGGAEIQELGTSGNMLELDFLNSIKYLREEFLAVLKTPAALVSVGDNGNKLSDMSDQQLKIFKYGAIEPRKRLIEEKITFTLLSKGFGITDWVFKLKDIDWRSDVETQGLIVADVERGLISLDEAREKRGYDGKVPGGGGDVPVVILQRELVPVHDLPNITSSQIAQDDVQPGADPAQQGTGPGGVAPPAGQAADPQSQQDRDKSGPAATNAKPDPASQKAKEAALDDLGKWRRVALRAFKEGRHPKPFISDHIGYVTGVAIAEALAVVESDDDIRAVFEAAGRDLS